MVCAKKKGLLNKKLVVDVIKEICKIYGIACSYKLKQIGKLTLMIYYLCMYEGNMWVFGGKKNDRIYVY